MAKELKRPAKKEQATKDFLETLFKNEQTLMDEILGTDGHAQE